MILKATFLISCASIWALCCVKIYKQWKKERELTQYYIKLTHLLREADKRGDEKMADNLRDKMDHIWYLLSYHQIQQINKQSVSPHPPKSKPIPPKSGSGIKSLQQRKK